MIFPKVSPNRMPGKRPKYLTSGDNFLILKDMQLIRGSSLLGYRGLVDELGADGEALLRAAGIAPHDAGDRDVFISARSMVRAVESAAAATRTPDFGLQLSAR